ncbi:MAG: pantoate--beta-alanine ligase [Candidatus Azobacteroides sp.]|nr:pantoate--beta-alanine ligase [Candidatus Azobacteroides sp.]
MKIADSVVELQAILAQERKENKCVGFVPTMGALHEGHIALARRCVAENDFSVVSIFVNPTQFNNKNDLVKYPRTLESDCALLQSAGVDVVFVPSEEEIYPEPDLRQFDFGGLETVMEGQFRPGHFNGVAQVVSRLFEIVKPDRAYFGEKDFQQLAIIQSLVKQLNLSVEIVPHPTVREPDGLAMSSRNRLLTPAQRKSAAAISQALFESKKNKGRLSISETKNEVINQINSRPELRVEYFDLVDGGTLQSVQNWEDSDQIVGCIAVYAGDVRLIDNIRM